MWNELSCLLRRIVASPLACSLITGCILTAQGFSGQAKQEVAWLIDRRMEDSTVLVIASSCPGGEARSGSGFLVGGGDTVVTNLHVVQGCGEVIAMNLKREITRRAQIAYEGQGSLDVAFLRLPGGSAGRPVVLGDSSSLQRLAPVIAAGYPAGLVLDSFLKNSSVEVKFASGILSSRSTLEGVRYLQMNIALNRGNSGGPLFDQCGRVVGINTLKVLEGMGWAVDVAEIEASLSERGIPFRRDPSVCESKASQSPDWTSRWIAVIAVTISLLTLLGTRGPVRRWMEVRFLSFRATMARNSATKPRLIVTIETEGWRTAFALERKPRTLGRQPGPDGIALPESCHLVSKRHLKMEHDEKRDHLLVTDLSSRNGTFDSDGGRLEPRKTRTLAIPLELWLGSSATLVRVNREDTSDSV